VALKRDRVKEILNLDRTYVDRNSRYSIVGCVYIVVSNQLCCCLGELAMPNGCW